MKGLDEKSVSNPDDQPQRAEIVEGANFPVTPVFDLEGVQNAIESSPLLGQNFSDRLKRNRNIQILLHGLESDTSMAAIVESSNKAYLEHLESVVVAADEGIIERYAQSTDKEPLSFRDRQAVVNMLINPTNRLYRTKEGQDVNLTEYLNNYYQALGVSVQIRFTTLPQNQIEGIERMFRIAKKDFSVDHLRNQEIAVPVIDITKDDRTISVPLIGADWDVTAPMRNPTTQEKLGDYIGLKIVHAPEYTYGIQTNLGFIVHEIDHAVRKALHLEKLWVEDAEDRIISEGTAEMARYRFGETQGQFDPRSGFHFQNDIIFAHSILSEGKPTGREIKHTYASGLVLAEQMRDAIGESKFWATTYQRESDMTASQLAQLRQQVVGQLEKQKEAAASFLVI